MSNLNKQNFLICSHEKCEQTFRLSDDIIVIQWFRTDHHEKWNGGVEQVPCRAKNNPWFTCYNFYHRSCYLQITSGTGTILNSDTPMEVEKLKELLVHKYTQAQTREIYRFLHNSLNCRMD